MKAQYKLQILGCGSSGGVPRIGNKWGSCDPKNKKNRRLRCSILVEKIDIDGTTTILIDTSPDIREQLLTAGVETLDAVLFTHHHADHMHGIDDLRMVVLNRRCVLPAWADKDTSNRLFTSFSYTVKQELGTKYPPILDLKEINGEINIDGKAGKVLVHPLKVKHGDIDALGFKFSNVAYIPDVSEIYEETWQELIGLDVLVIDALRYKPHPNHANLEMALKWIEELKPKRAYLTNMHNDLDYETVDAETPENVKPCHDGLVIDI